MGWMGIMNKDQIKALSQLLDSISSETNSIYAKFIEEHGLREAISEHFKPVEMPGMDAHVYIHDCFVEAYLDEDEGPTSMQILNIYNQLPERIRDLAEMWGWGDTEVREDIYKWLKTKKASDF